MVFSIIDARANAQEAKTLLDRNDLETNRYNRELAITAFKKHLNGCIENPTLGLMAEKRDILDVKKENPRAFHKNYSSGLNSQAISNLRDIFAKRFKEVLYPKTWKSRLKIIRNERIVFYGTKQVFSFKKLLSGLFK